jgi:hypothetical protein
LASCSQDESIKLWRFAASGEPYPDAFPQACLPTPPTLTQTLRIPRPYEALNITQASGLTAAQRAALRQLGAVETAVESA